MKKILLNGCSFVAGDALTWNIHHPDIDWVKYIASRKIHPIYSTNQIEQYRIHYNSNLRPVDNLKGQLEKLLTTDVTDISVDGNSNDNIAMTTIGFLNRLSLEERQQYHVCIGWTEFTRRIKWLVERRLFFNLTCAHLDDKSYKEYREYIKETIINPDTKDHFYNFFKNVFLLQSYLKSNNISYTFWKSLGKIFDIEDIDTMMYSNTRFSDSCIPFNHEKCFDRDEWINFNKNQYPWLSESWQTLITERKQFVSPDNRHPSLEAVKEFAIVVADKVKPLV